MNNLNFQNMNMMGPRGGNGVGLQQTILAHYRNQQKIPTGWQQSVSPEERAGLTFQLLSMFRMLKPELSEPEVIRQAIGLENNQFLQSPSKDQYSTQMKQRLQTLTALRQQRAATMQNNINNAMTPAQMGMMGQPGLQPPRQNTPQQFNPGFPNPQLQRPMQPSPIPMSQGSSAMGINSTNLNQQQGQNGQQPGAQQIQQPRQQIDNAAIMRLTRKLMDSATEEMKQKFTADVANWPPERRQQLMNQNIDPVTWRYRQHAEMLIRAGRVPGALLQGPQAINQAGGGVQQPGQPNQMPNQMNPRPPGQDFDFNAIANQQIEALRVQDQGQQVVPASNNANGAQMVGFSAQPQQPGQAQNAALAQQRQAYQNATLQRQAQVQAQQAQAQARAQQHMQQQQAQAAQARNTNQMLTGMNGGLNQPPGAGQSPAMPMLNRPMVPPGQTGPTTPQQQPQNHVPRMTPQDPQASQLMREAQQQQRAQIAMASQGQPLTDQLRMSMIPPEIPPETKQQLLRAQEPQFRAYIANYYASRGRTPLQNAQFPTGKPAIGQPNMGMNPTQTLQMGQMGLSNQMMNGNNLGNLVRGPGISPGQQAPNGINAQQIAMAQRPGGIPQNQRLANAQALLQQSPGIIKTTDGRPFPPNVITAQIKQNIPPDVKTWAQLKQWVTQNSNLAPNLEVQKLLLLQVLHFQDLMRHSHIQQQQQQNALVGGNLQQQINPGGMAATAPMGPGAIQQQPNMANMAHVASLAAQVTPQEIAAFRSRLNPQQLATASDQQLRMLITQQKMNARQQQHAFMNLQAQRNQVPQPQPVMPGSGAAGARPPPSQLQVTQATQATPQPKPANKPPQPSKAAQSTTQITMNKGVKRSSDDAAESTTETSAANVAPQAPAMIPSKSQQGVGNLTPEQLSKLTPSQRAQLLKVQDASGAKSTQRSLPPQQELQARMKDPAREQRYRALLAEEDKNTPRGPPVQISPEGRAQLQQLIREKLTHIRKVEQALRIFLAAYEGGEGIEDLARSVIKARILLLRQINQSDGTLQEQLTINEADFTQNARHILSFAVKVMSSMQNQQGQKTVVTQGQQPQTTQAQTQAARQPQLNAANLKINEAQQRQQKAPQAPTTDRPPFQIGGQSPRGAPTYFETAPKVPTNLVLPEKKRQKVDGQAATPSTKASPHIGANKGTSPDLKRQSQPERPMEQRQTFKCKVADCDYSARGFDTQAELDAHVGSLHARVDDPLQFALDSVAEFLDVDPKTGQAKSDPNAASRVAKPPAVAARTLQPVKSGQTPNIPHSVTTPAGAQSAATPMTRVPTQTGIKSSPSTSLLKTPQTGAKAATPSTGVPGKTTPSSVKPILKEPELITVPQPDQVEDLQPLIPASLGDFSYGDIYAALDTNDPFTTLDIKDEDNSWILRSRPSSPMNTPDSSSKDTPSTRQSDISENDNLQINLDVKDVDMPDAWLAAALDGSSLPLDVQLSEDLQTLGVALPPLDDSDMMLFYGDNALLDLEAMGSMENMATLDPAVFG